jgi:hypothetical protein
MAGRSRTTKKLAQRIDLNYFKRLYSIPRWRRILSFGLTAIGLFWLAWGGLSGRQKAFNAGPLAVKHALFTNNCNVCHAVRASFGSRVADQACLSCHDGPVHQAQQTFTPACTACHVEHQGSFRLANARDESCTQCHSNLKTKSGRTDFAASVTSFSGGHPEFRKLSDPGTVRLNHEVHLKKDLLGPNGPVQLFCTSCHVSSGQYVAPIVYEKQCAECHPLVFDRRFQESVPHERPEIVIDFVVKEFTQYIAAHPNEIAMVEPAPDPRIVRPPLPPARNAAEWISRRVEDTKQLLWRKTCKECHTLSFPSSAGLPGVAKSAIPARWMKHAFFDHDAHQMLGCAECHASAATSRETSDVLLPGIDTCRRCHRPGPDAAGSRCFECHAYHDWSKGKKVDGRFKVSSF